MTGKLFYISLLSYIVAVAVQSASADNRDWRPTETTPPKPRCTAQCKGGPNDECVACGTECPLTCDQPNQRPCPRVCRPNVCQCKTGYVRNGQGMCVLPNQCKKSQPLCTRKCTGGPHDKCTTCGSACPRTCANSNPSVCTLQCLVNVCECEKNYVRNEEGQCVLPSQCKKPEPSCTRKCTGGPHDKCTNCGSACAPTCANLNPRLCTLQCRVNVCQCENGYVRDNRGKCILKEECPKKW